MNNEFGYLDIKTFYEINDQDQKLVIINKKDDKLELKVKDIEKFSTFDSDDNEFGKLIRTKIFYGINSKYQPLTLYHCSITNSTLNIIPYSIVTSQMYIIGNEAQSAILHFTNKTKVEKFKYYNDNIKYIFPSSSMIIKRKENEMNIEAKKEKEKMISCIDYNDNKITIKLVSSYTHSGNIYNFNIKPVSFFEVSFQKSIDLDMVLKISRSIDSIIHLFLFTNGRSKELTLYDTKKNSYEYHDLRYNDKEEKQPIFYLDKRENSISNFNKLFKLFINIDNANSNSFFPFLNYDRNINLMEIQFLEYYRTLEYINMELQKKKGKGKNNLFLLQLLKQYPKVKNVYFNNIQDEVIEKEIRSLRNYYSHEGYYLKELPVPTRSPKYTKKVDIQWLYDVKMFIKTIAYLEVYALAGIKINESYLMTYLR